MTLASLWVGGRPKIGIREVEKQMLYEKLEREASGGATMRELEAEIDKQGRLPSNLEREETWLYAWALRRRQEPRLLASAGEEDQSYGYAGDAGAG
jgi:hypothetical protein